jgi:GntR family transcriptional regulator/MocR family aminotransferase
MRRRQALLAWAQRCDAAIVEDDYDSEFRYGGRPLEPLQSHDSSGRVLYVGSFSKVMLPTLRLGFLVAPPPLHAAFRKAKYLADWHTAVPTQAAAAMFIEDGYWAITSAACAASTPNGTSASSRYSSAISASA